MNILAKRTLVLNKNWLALGTVSVKRALKHLWKTYKDGTPFARVIDPKTFETFTWEAWAQIKAAPDEPTIHSPSVNIKVPSIIIFSKYDKYPRIERSNFNRKNIFRRDKNQCQFCSKKFAISDLTIDHVIPKSQGGKSSWENTVCCCVSCNRKKANCTPEQAGMHLINGTPKKPDFSVLIDVGEFSKEWSHFIHSEQAV